MLVFLAVIYLAGLSGKSFAQITVNSSADMDFGTVEYSSIHSGTVRLGTNGSTSITGAGLVYVQGGSAGNVSISAGNSGILEIKCETSGTLPPLGGGSSITLANTEISVNTGTNFGSGQECNGIGAGDSPAATVDLSSSPDPNIFVGGEIIIPSNALTSTNYSSNNAGGSPITLRITFQ